MDELSRLRNENIALRTKVSVLEQQSIGAAVDHLTTARAGEGDYCPVCGRWAKDNRFSLDASKILALFGLWRHRTGYAEWVHYTEVILPGVQKKKMSGAYGGLAWWNLAEQKPNDGDHTKKTAGFWRITERGKQFILGQITVPKFVTVFDNKVLFFSGKEVTVKDCLRDKFDYTELMRRPSLEPGDEPRELQQ